jgi:hypothetical protein
MKRSHTPDTLSDAYPCKLPFDEPAFYAANLAVNAAGNLNESGRCMLNSKRKTDSAATAVAAEQKSPKQGPETKWKST